jgi:L-cysteine:1D-myo-inositol 2-amino-2-deoxy-alpha-D-glucopyranoside ligase
VNSWPTIYRPPVDSKFDFPPLTVNTWQGERSFESFDKIRMYVCGITPYDATHLGHAATYLTFDLINRYFQSARKPVVFVENITDIDEPLLERAVRDSTDWRDLAANQISLYESDMTALRILPPAAFVPVTQAMNLVSDAISKIADRGFVYKVENDLYFDISSFLSDLPIPPDEALRIFAERGGDPLRDGKRHPLDPVLWLANRNDEPGWASVHGYGRPGWHIECCAISLRYLLGQNFAEISPGGTCIEIQGGGSDLIFPHHFMSAAQATALTGKPFAYSFIHSGMVGLDGQKMSKSKGNLVFVSKLLAAGTDPMEIRAALIASHYSQNRMWSNATLESARLRVAKWRSALSREEVAPTDAVIAAVISALSRDLDTPSALLELDRWSEKTEEGQTGGSAGQLSRAIDSLLGLAL